MSAAAAPISAELFALAIKDLPASSLHFKARELRNSLAHLDYSNQQLLPYTDGTNGEADPDCLDAIKQNEIVIERHNARLALLKIEVESRGMNWREFMTSEELDEQSNDTARNGDLVDGEGNLVNGNAAGHNSGTNGTNTTSRTRNAGTTSGNGTTAFRSRYTEGPWADGTFTVGTISSSTVPSQLDTRPRTPSQTGSREAAFQSLTGEHQAGQDRREARTAGGPRLNDDQIRQGLAELLQEDDGGGMHL